MLWIAFILAPLTLALLTRRRQPRRQPLRVELSERVGGEGSGERTFAHSMLPWAISTVCWRFCRAELCDPLRRKGVDRCGGDRAPAMELLALDED